MGTVPEGRDRLGILGASVGTAVALSGAHANHVVGLNDFYIECIAYIDPSGTSPTAGNFMQCGAGAHRWLLLYHRPTSRLRLYIDSLDSYSNPIDNATSRWIACSAFVHRAGLAYFYCNGSFIGSADVSSKVAVDLISNEVLSFGRTSIPQYDPVSGQLARLFVIDPANFPSEAERNAIVAERWANPDAESPTLYARTNYATERRVDVNCNDVNYNATTLANAGTGAATFTIGGGLAWSAVRSVAERAAIEVPVRDWYAFDTTHEATATADIGCVDGASIVEIIYRDLHRCPMATDYLAQIAAGAGDYLYLRASGANTIFAQCAHNGSTVNTYLTTTGYKPISLDGIHVLHMYVDQTGNRQAIYIDGQRHMWSAAAVAQALSGNLTLKLGDSSQYDGIVAMRLWNVAVGLTGDVPAAIYGRVGNPWVAPTTLCGATLRGNWEMRLDASIGQGASSTLVKNLANPGTGDLTISGAGTWASSTKMAVRGQS